MSLIRVLIFIYIIFTKPCSHYPDTDANQHSDVSEHWAQQHLVFVGHPNHLPLWDWGGPCLTIYVQGEHITRQAKVCKVSRVTARHPTFHWTLKITQGARKHLTRPHTKPVVYGQTTQQILERASLKLVLINHQLEIIYYNWSKI